MRLKFLGTVPPAWYLTSAHYTQWLLVGDNCLYSEGCKPHSWCIMGNGRTFGKWAGSALGREFLFLFCLLCK